MWIQIGIGFFSTDIGNQGKISYIGIAIWVCFYGLSIKESTGCFPLTFSWSSFKSMFLHLFTVQGYIVRFYWYWLHICIFKCVPDTGQCEPNRQTLTYILLNVNNHNIRRVYMCTSNIVLQLSIFFDLLILLYVHILSAWMTMHHLCARCLQTSEEDIWIFWNWNNR